MRRFFVSLLLGALAVAQAAEKLAGGPLVVNAGTRKATVVWIVQTSEVKLGEAPGELASSAPVLKTEKVTYTGLKPGTTYYYDVFGSGEGKGRFKTPPAAPAAFRFTVLGDTRTRHDVHRKIVSLVLKNEPDFVIHTGDIVSDGDDTGLWPIFFSIEKELLNKTVFLPALGNHERNSHHFYDFFDLKTGYYSFDWGAVHISVLNSDRGNVARNQAARDQFWNEQLRWLEDDLARSKSAGLRFVVMHHPPFTAVRRRQGDRMPVLEDLVALFEKYKVHAVFNGHDHNYQHHLRNGVHYIVTGGGGAPLYPTDAPIPGITVKAESVENIVEVEVEGKKARLDALTPDGRKIETIEINP